MLKPLEYAYWAVAIAEIASEASGNETLRFFTKPLLMIVLVLFYVKNITGPRGAFHKLLIAAFIFSWVGDVALMFVPAGTAPETLMGLPKNPNFFLVGLGGFLVTHILYAIAFTKVSYPNVKALLPQRFWVAVPLLVYMGALSSVLLPAIYGNELTKPFLAPVVVYSTAIATMVVIAINRYKRVNDKSFALVFAGALIFMFSDSIIAINKFLSPVPMAGVFIMVLYIGGQYLIAKGSLAQFNKE
ncbi:MAG TPA: lysoplasmalogenase [Chitinophagales bacterium]|nr:lysoplasmalogenase [Chitinophagales bacterium]